MNSAIEKNDIYPATDEWIRQHSRRSGDQFILQGVLSRVADTFDDERRILLATRHKNMTRRVPGDHQKVYGGPEDKYLQRHGLAGKRQVISRIDAR